MLVNNLSGEEKYEITLGENICRFCLRTDKTEMKNIFMEETLNVEEICSFASIKISKSDELPENVCLNCLKSIEDCLSFRIKIQESDRVLRNSGVLVAITEIPSTTNGIGQRVIENKSENSLYNFTRSKEKSQKNVNPLQKLILDLDISDEWEENDNLFQASIVPSDEIRHKCSTCHKVFETKSKYDQHVITHDNSIATCTICNEKLKNLKQLEAHLKYHSSTSNLCCKVCKKSFLSKQILENHIKSHNHEECDDISEEHQSCRICTKEFSSSVELNNHLVTHDTVVIRKFSCKLCAKHFPTNGLLRKHISSMHDSEQSFDCDKCEMKFTHVKHLREHKNLHTENKKFSCPTCYKKFLKNNQLQLHLKTHSKIRDIPCPMCNMKFSQKGNMKRHVSIVHKK